MREKKNEECILKFSKELICASLCPYYFFISIKPKTDSFRHSQERENIPNTPVASGVTTNILIFVKGGCESRNEVVFQCQGWV